MSLVLRIHYLPVYRGINNHSIKAVNNKYSDQTCYSDMADVGCFLFLFFFVIYLFFICVLRRVKIISLILKRVNRMVGQKLEIPEKVKE